MGSANIAFDDAARCLAELGHPHRLQIFQLLIRAGDVGLAVGEIQKKLGIPKSTLAHHLAQLRAAGLMTQEREGRIQRCRIAAERASAFVNFFVTGCEGLPGIEDLTT